MPRTLRELSKDLRAKLRCIGVDPDEINAEAELVLDHLTDLSRSRRLQELDVLVTEAQERRIAEILRRREEGDAIQYCLGEAWFMNHKLRVSSGVFIPRSDTETLVETVLQLLADVPDPRLAEVGTGSGAIAISILCARPDAKLWAAELSEAAYQTTLANAESSGVLARLALSKANWTDWIPTLQEPLDAFVSNPPYIPEKQSVELAREVLREPHLALFGSDEDGLGFYRAFSKLLRPHMKKSGFIAVETGDGQAESVVEIFAANHWQNPFMKRDLTGNNRVVVAYAEPRGF